MSRLKFVLAALLAALLLSACGITQKPFVGTAVRHINRARGSHARLDDPRKAHRHCLGTLKARYHVGYHYFRERSPQVGSLPAIQVGRVPTGPTVVFYPVSPLLLKISGRTQGGILIGSAVVYPRHAGARLAKAVVNCVDEGVPG